MPLRTYDDFIARIAAGYYRLQPIGGIRAAATTGTIYSTQLLTMQRIGFTQLMPSSLPSGVTAFVPTCLSLQSSTATQMVLVGEIINLGNLSLSTPTFTDGSSMPTDSILGTASANSVSALIAEVTTVLNATPGSMTVTYVDQSGNSAETTGSLTLTASAAVGTAAFIPLNSGDWGVRDITTATRTGGTTPTGVITFYGMRPISLLEVSPAGAGQVSVDNLMTCSVNRHRLGTSAELAAYAFSTTAKSVVGSVFLVGDS